MLLLYSRAVSTRCHHSSANANEVPLTPGYKGVAGQADMRRGFYCRREQSRR
jgi:hypothetical protein